MKERLKLLRQSLKFTQEQFANRLGLKRQTVAAYEIGKIEPSDSTCLLICREFNVNEEWLRTGKGEMFVQLSRKQRFTDLAADLIKEPDSFKARFIEGMAELDEKDWEDIEQIVMRLASKTAAPKEKE